MWGKLSSKISKVSGKQANVMPSARFIEYC